MKSTRKQYTHKVYCNSLIVYTAFFYSAVTRNNQHAQKLPWQSKRWRPTELLEHSDQAKGVLSYTRSPISVTGGKMGIREATEGKRRVETSHF